MPAEVDQSLLTLSSAAVVADWMAALSGLAAQAGSSIGDMHDVGVLESMSGAFPVPRALRAYTSLVATSEDAGLLAADRASTAGPSGDGRSGTVLADAEAVLASF